MSSKALKPPILDEKNAEFITRGLSIVASSTAPDGSSAISRVAGCRVSADRRKVTLLLSRSQSVALLGAISSSGRIAVVFTEPLTHRTIQLKSRNTTVSEPQKGDTALLQKYSDAFVDQVRRLGFDETLIRALIWLDPEQLAALTFTPDEAFEQTPGPGAGNRLR
jgi:hypothetical protein